MEKLSSHTNLNPAFENNGNLPILLDYDVIK